MRPRYFTQRQQNTHAAVGDVAFIIAPGIDRSWDAQNN
jgi:hypothetical protein